MKGVLKVQPAAKISEIKSKGGLVTYRTEDLTERTVDLDDCTDCSTMYMISVGAGNVSNVPATGITVYNVKTAWGLVQLAIHYERNVWYRRTLFVKKWSEWTEW